MSFLSQRPDDPHAAQRGELPFTEVLRSSIRITEDRNWSRCFCSETLDGTNYLLGRLFVTGLGQDRVGYSVGAKSHASRLARPEVVPRHRSVAGRAELWEIDVSGFCKALDHGVLFRLGSALATLGEVSSSLRSLVSVGPAIAQRRLIQLQLDLSLLSVLEDIGYPIPPKPGLSVQEPRRHECRDRAIKFGENGRRDTRLLVISVVDGKSDGAMRRRAFTPQPGEDFLDTNQIKLLSAENLQDLTYGRWIPTEYTPLVIPKSVHPEDRGWHVGERGQGACDAWCAKNLVK